MNCKPKPFCGNEDIVGPTRWTEKMESIFDISFRPEDYKFKFGACTLADVTLSWWNSYAKTMGVNKENVMY